MVGVAANAQKCTKKAGKKCCAKKAAAAASADTAPATRVASAMTEADIAAKADENISVRTCSMSGTTSYYQKSVCDKSGAISYSEVKYDGEAKKFTQVASASMEREADAPVAKKACTKGDKKCCKKGDKGDKKCCKGDKKTCSKKAEK